MEKYVYFVWCLVVVLLRLLKRCIQEVLIMSVMYVIRYV